MTLFLVTSMEDMFDESLISNYDEVLLAWSAQSLQNGVLFNAGNSSYSASSQSARDVLTEVYNWTVKDGGIE